MPAADSGRSTADPLAALARRDLRGWRGLSPGTTVADVAAVFAVDREFAGASPLGARFEPAEWMAASADAFPDGVRIWFRGEHVVLFDAQLELDAPGDSLLAELGEPEARWDAALGPVPLAGSEWVYPDRGLTLYVDPETRRIDRLLAYEPTTLETYAAVARPHTRVDPLPEGGGV